MTLDDILKMAMDKKASDIHLKAGIVPVIRRHGVLRPLDKVLPRLSPDEIMHMAERIMTVEQATAFQRNKEVDLGYGVSGLGRFRVNVFLQRGTVRMVIRNIPHDVPTLEGLNLPEIVHKIAQTERGLILVTGATGSGKSSTIAAIINQINQSKNKHILTLEDPIEFLIRDRKSVITQRELGVDTLSFANSLRAALRQDPDVIFIGEMRDRETIETAMIAAETGHLVLSTLHTLDARETVNRIIAAFDLGHQQQIRLQLAATLRAVISQRLARRKDKKGFVPVVEVMVNNARIREMIETQDRTKNILDAIEEGRTGYEMQSFDQSLMDLVAKEVITYETALQTSTHPENFSLKYAGISKGGDDNWSDQPLKNKSEKEWASLDDVEVEGDDNT